MDSDCTQNAVAGPVCKASSSEQDDVYSTENIIILEQLREEIDNLRNQEQKAEQEINTLRGENFQLHNQEQALRRENVQLHNQVQELGQILNTNTLWGENVQLHNQVQTLRREISRLRNEVKELEQEIKVQSARYEERLRNAEDQFNIAGNVLKSQELDIATKDAVASCLMHQLNQVSRHRSLLEKQLMTLIQQIMCNKSHVQQISSWIISREEVSIRENDILGKGGFGVVYKGVFRCDQVAVKQLHKLSPEHRKLFEREMNIMSQCRHPNLLLLIGATNDQESPLLVTECLHCSLRDLIKEYGKSKSQLDKKLIVILALDVAKGLCYLHGKTPPIIHRDLKSDNVLLEKQGDSWKAKLSDYGTANFCSEHMTPNQGTAIYAAPEAWTAHLQTPKMDVYSFGWLVYEMCTGNRPGSRNQEEIQQQIELVSSPDLKRLIYACILNDPAQRPPMDQVTDFLKRLSNTGA